jgi:hypothetical protein
VRPLSVRLEDVEAAATAWVDVPRSTNGHSPAQLHHGEHVEEREVKVDVEARADVRERPESPGAAAIARREESRQWPRVACSCLEWLGLSLMALWRSARRSPRGRVAARRVATGRHRRDELNVGMIRPIVKPTLQPTLQVSSRRVCRKRLPQPFTGVTLLRISWRPERADSVRTLRTRRFHPNDVVWADGHFTGVTWRST